MIKKTDSISKICKEYRKIWKEWIQIEIDKKETIELIEKVDFLWEPKTIISKLDINGINLKFTGKPMFLNENPLKNKYFLFYNCEFIGRNCGNTTIINRSISFENISNRISFVMIFQSPIGIHESFIYKYSVLWKNNIIKYNLLKYSRYNRRSDITR